MGLCITRKVGQRIVIGDQIVITVSRLDQGRVILDVEAPEEITIDREELRIAKDETAGRRRTYPVKDCPVYYGKGPHSP